MKIMISTFLFVGLISCANITESQDLKKNREGDTFEIPMDTVKMPVRPQILADTVKFTGEIIERGDGFIVIDQGFITVIGRAGDAKGGAAIASEGRFYFINDLINWPKDVIHKKVRASGRCLVYDYRELMNRYPYRQGFRSKKILQDAKWEVIED